MPVEGPWPKHCLYRHDACLQDFNLLFCMYLFTCTLGVYYIFLSLSKIFPLRTSEWLCFTCSKGEGQGSPLVEQFVARKADILFCPAWKTATVQEEEHEEEEAAGQCRFLPH